jgi:cytochrome c biogenesis protein CcmG/thiol:disulfide interchange protein DsbE
MTSLSLVVSSCSQTDVGPLPDAPEATTLDVLEASLKSSGAPSVVNVWASWCLPCRSEAPLIAKGSQMHPDVDFIGLNVKDTPSRARRFMAEYLSDAEMIHLADPQGRIPVDLGGGSGVPITFFYDSTGLLVATHRGIIDEPTLARFLDEIDR